MLIPILFKDNNVSYVTLIQQVSQETKAGNNCKFWIHKLLG